MIRANGSYARSFHGPTRERDKEREIFDRYSDPSIYDHMQALQMVTLSEVKYTSEH